MATVSIKLRTDKKPDANGKYPLAIRVYHKKTFYLFFPFRIAEEDWREEASRVRASHHNYNLLNNIIQEKFSAVDDAVIIATSRNRNVSPDRLKKIIEQEFEEDGSDFIEYYRKYVDGLLPEFSHSYHELHNSVLNHFDRFFDGTLHFDDLDLQAMRRFKSGLMEKGLSPNSVSRYLKLAKNVYNEAVKDGVTEQGSNPFELLEYPSEKVKKTHLSFSDIQELTDIDFNEWTLRWKVQKAFLFSFWTAGMRFSDVAQLQWSNIKNWTSEDTKLSYTMRKNGKHVEMPILPPAKKILEELKPKVASINIKGQRVFKIIDDEYGSEQEEHSAIKRANSYTNTCLQKVIFKRMSTDKHVTFHISRHSFASCFEELDLPVQLLQSLLAHSSLKTTEEYRNNFQSKQNKKAMGDFWNLVKRASGEQ